MFDFYSSLANKPYTKDIAEVLRLLLSGTPDSIMSVDRLVPFGNLQESNDMFFVYCTV